MPVSPLIFEVKVELHEDCFLKWRLKGDELMSFTYKDMPNVYKTAHFHGFRLEWLLDAFIRWIPNSQGDEALVDGLRNHNDTVRRKVSELVRPLLREVIRKKFLLFS